MDHYLNIKKISCSISVLALICPFSAYSWEQPDIEHSFNFPGETVIGETRQILYSGINTPQEIARKFHVGYLEIAEANPYLAPSSPVDGRDITLPTSWILPEIMAEGILINLAEMRLYFFHNSGNNSPVVTSFPIGIGRSGYDTPTGNFTVEKKLEDPTWYPNEASRERNPELPIAVPPGPDNPLGQYWIQLSLNGYGIHGTNRPKSIGKRISLGCIRLFPEDIEWLFNKVRTGMAVRIINMPVKFGMRDGRKYVEIHRNGLGRDALEKKAIKIKEEKGLEGIDEKSLLTAAEKALGIPVSISKNSPTL